MRRIVVNLDWGSCYLKGCARLMGRSGKPAQILGHLEQAALAAVQTIQLPGGLSLKAAFLTGKLAAAGLQAHRAAVVAMLGKHLAAPLAGRLEAWGDEPFELRINIHTPLQVTFPETVLGAGGFNLFDPGERLVAPAYRPLEEWDRLMRHRGQPAENAWAHWLAGCLASALARTGLAGARAQFCFLPESLTCVQDLVGVLGRNESRQFLVMDVGHFTTDYALVVFHHIRQERMIVRRADSIFEAGHQFISAEGAEAWVGKVMKVMQRFARADHPIDGIDGYTDLGVVLVGGGAAGLGRSHREALLGEVQAWAQRDDYFREALRDGRRKVFLASPPHLTGPFQMLERAAAVHALESVTADLHVPAVLACGLADARTGLRLGGEDAIEVLRRKWERADVEPLPLPAPPAPVPAPRTVTAPPAANPVQPPPPSRREQAEALFEAACGKDERGLYLLSLGERKALLGRASGLGFRPATLALALLRITKGTAQEERLGQGTLKAWAAEGDPEAMFLLGKLHVQGQFRSEAAVPGRGLRLLLSAAKCGHRRAMALVADCYEKGIGTTVSQRAANHWRQEAAPVDA